MHIWPKGARYGLCHRLASSVGEVRVDDEPLPRRPVIPLPRSGLGQLDEAVSAELPQGPAHVAQMLVLQLGQLSRGPWTQDKMEKQFHSPCACEHKLGCGRQTVSRAGSVDIIISPKCTRSQLLGINHWQLKHLGRPTRDASTSEQIDGNDGNYHQEQRNARPCDGWGGGRGKPREENRALGRLAQF